MNCNALNGKRFALFDKINLPGPEKYTILNYHIECKNVSTT